ncbi:sulfotransferase [Tropicimonas sediminicola]|uniref:Sulfotransferase family protein n=1 Tax=Tropicimonas sediminicola TaxID=1031541 RepID=A0A239ME27_9RHOB|nr:sulfotransferase [Tropicimonas sediminicola]SNT41287.1 Sulfotransferase family protein [Tropicimonas sediminicola]
MADDRHRISTDIISCARPGPFVIVGRPHSGTRAVANALLEAGVFNGAEIADGFLDSEIWFARFVLPILSDPAMPALLDQPDAAKKLIDVRLHDTLSYFFKGHDPADARPWGWKLSETLFFMRELTERFPDSRFVHVIRDGRDVMLSDGGYFQLTMPPPSARAPKRLARKLWKLATNPHQRFLRKFDYRRFCEMVTFGEHGMSSWKDIDLADPQAIVRHRFRLQMQSWIHCVSSARRIGRDLGPTKYFELRYEDFCQEPRAHARAMFEFLEITPSETLLTNIEKTVSRARIGKWRRFVPDGIDEQQDFENALAHGRLLLAELGYTD